MNPCLYLLLATLLLLPTPLMAKTTMDCHGDNHIDFSVLVPDGWSGSSIDHGCLVRKNDHESVIGVAYIVHGGNSAEDIARGVSTNLKIENPKFTVDGTTDCTVTGTLNGKKTHISFTKGHDAQDPTVQMVMRLGTDEETMDAIFDSVEFK